MMKFKKIGRPDPEEAAILRKVEALTTHSDLNPEDHFFNRLVLAGFGSRKEISEEWDLVTCIRAHQQLDIQAETERIAHRMRR